MFSVDGSGLSRRASGPNDLSLTWVTPSSKLPFVGRKPGVEPFPTAGKQAREDAVEASNALLSLTEDALAGRENWKRVSEQLRFVELKLNSLRFVLLRAMLAKRPAQISFRAREMAQTLARWADALDDPDMASARREKLESSIGKLRITMTRVASPAQLEGSDLLFLRTVFIDTIETVSELGKSTWRKTLPEDPRERWLVLADEVIRIYGEACDPSRVPDMKKQRSKIALAVESCSNRGGRGRFARVLKSEAVPEACRAIGFTMGEYSGARAVSRRKKKRKG